MQLLRNKSVKDYTDASVAVENVVTGFKAKTDERNAAAVGYWNADPQKAGNFLEETARTAQEAYRNAMAKFAVVKDKQSLNFFTNPLAYVSAQMTLPADIAEYQKYKGQFEGAETAHNETLSAVTATGQMNKTIEQQTSVALQDAKNRQLLAKSSADQAALLLKSGALNLDGIKVLSSLTAEDLSSANHSIQTTLSLAHYELSLRSADSMEAVRKINAEMLSERLEQKQTTAAEQQKTLEWYNTGARKFGAPEQNDYKVVYTLLKSNQPQAVNFVGYGQQSEVSGTQFGIPLAATPAQVISTLMKSRANPVVGDENSPARFLADQFNTVSKNPAWQAQKPEGKEAILNDAIRIEAVKQQAGISMEKPNMYKAPSISAIAAAIPPEALGNRFIQESIIPLGVGAGNNQPTNPDLILGAAKAVLEKDPSRFNEVKQGIAQFFRAAVKVNNASKDYAGMVLPQQMTYNARLKFGSLFGDSTHDMTNETDLARLLLMNQTTLGQTPFGFR
jgi:hypothetical protein